MNISSENKLCNHPTAWIFGAILLFALAIQPSWSYFTQIYFKNPIESHSLWILMLAGFLLIREFKNIELNLTESSTIGLLSVLLFLFLYSISVIADINLLAALFSFGLIAGMIQTLFGWTHLKILLFPIFVLTLSLPITTAADMAFGYDVRLLSAKLAFEILHFMGLAKELMGTRIIMPEYVLAVDSSCSGLKTLSVLLIMNLALGHLLFKEFIWKRIILFFAALVIAGIANSLRITVIAIIADRYGLDYAMGAMHSYSGLFVFSLSLFLLWPVYVLLEKK
jgi:exosortase